MSTLTPAAAAPAAQPNHLVITPVWDSTITKDPNAAAIEATLNKMILNFETDYTTPITVTVKFVEQTTGLAASLTPRVAVDYPTYLKALTAHATDANDKTAIASLPVTTDNPVNGGADIAITYANARALGFSATPAGGLDSTMYLNMAEFNLSRFPSQINSSKYDLISSSSHEMDEVLGITSLLDFYNSGTAIPTDRVAGEDLFRYDASTRARSYNTNANTESAFSIDGGKDLVALFNQTKGGDFNDWYSPPGWPWQVQSANGTPGATPNLGNELTVLDVLGYSLASGVIGGYKADLTPAALEGWSSPLPVSTTKGATVDSATLTTADTLYIDAAIENNGETSTAAAETNTIVLDGKTVFTFNDASGLAVNNSFYSTGLSLGKLAAGKHTLTINADTGNKISEIIESNNTYTRTFVVTAAAAKLPDLQPYTPSGWSSPLVVAIAAGATTDAKTITTSDSIYVDFSYINAGTAALTKDFYIALKLNGTTVYTVEDTSEPYEIGDYNSVTDLQAGKLAAGTYTLELLLDTTNLVAESNENNNTYTRTFTVTGAAVAPAITKQPVSETIAAGSKATFTAAASGTPTPTVQWQISTNAGKTYANISGATSTTYSFTPTVSQSGDYFRAVFTNSKGTATTTHAALTVTPAATAPVITKQPASLSVTSGTKVTFTAAASGTPTPTVQWQVSTNAGKTYTNISGATATSYSFTAASTETGYYYRAVFTNSKGTATTTHVVLTVTTAKVAVDLLTTDVGE